MRISRIATRSWLNCWQGSGSFGDGNGKVEGGAFAVITDEPDRAALHLYQGPGNIEAKTGAGRITDALVF